MPPAFPLTDRPRVPQGTWTSATPPARRALLRADQAERLILADFSAVDFVDSTTVGVLIGAWKRAGSGTSASSSPTARPRPPGSSRLLGVRDLLVDPREPPRRLLLA